MRSRQAFWIALALILLFTIAQASARLGKNLNIDEPYTANLVHRSLPQLWEEFQRVGYEIPYHLLLKGWNVIFGESEAALRGLSLLFYCLTILTVGWAGKRILGKQGGLIAAFLLSVSAEMGLVHATNARPYALLGLQVALALAVCYSIMRLVPQDHASSPRKTFTLAVLLTVLHLLGLMNHPIYIFYIVATCIAGLFVSRLVSGLLVLCAGVALAVDLILWGSAMQKSGFILSTWMQVPGLSELVDALLGLWGTESSLLLFACMGILSLVRFGRIISTGKFIAINIILIVSILLLIFFVSQFKPVFNAGRTPILYLPVACLLAAALISRTGLQKLTLALMAALAVNSAVYALHISQQPESNPTRVSIEYVVSRAQCADTLILGSLSFSGVEYYLRRLDTPDCIRHESFPLSTESHPGWMDTITLLSQRELLAEEAASTASRLARQPGSTVWLFDINGQGDYREITSFLKSELDSQFKLVETLQLRGLYFNSVFVYAVPQDVTEP